MFYLNKVLAEVVRLGVKCNEPFIPSIFVEEKARGKPASSLSLHISNFVFHLHFFVSFECIKVLALKG